MQDVEQEIPSQKFLLTIDLNRLAKWLRMMGYDAVVFPSIPISEVIRRTTVEKRILVTRSIKLSKDKRQFTRILIHSNNHLEQLKEILVSLVPGEKYFFSRCLCCNRPLYPIQKDKVAGLIPERSYKLHEDFHVCRHCGRFYWPGTHWKAMKEKIEEILTIRLK
jgi:uncharacterized protein